MPYFLIRSDEDGISIHKYKTTDDLLKVITPDKDGATYFGSELVFLKQFPERMDYWDSTTDNSVILIKGEIVRPELVEVAKKYKL